MARYRELRPQVGDLSSLLTFATVAVLRDPSLEGGTRLEPAGDESEVSLTERLGVSPPTLRSRIFGKFDLRRVEELEPFIRDIERVRYPDGGGQLWFLARRLFGTSDDRLNDRVHPDWWPELRQEKRVRGAPDIVLASEAAIAWLRARPSDAPNVLSQVDQEAVTRVAGWLELLMGGGHGFATLAVDRLATLLRVSWEADSGFGQNLVSQVATIVEDEPGGNLALRALDRCVRATPLASHQDRDLIDSISDAAKPLLDAHDGRGPDLWAPDVFGPRLARVLAHHSRADRAYWADWLAAVAAGERDLDVGTRRACLWATAETTATRDGGRRWKALRSQLEGNREFEDVLENFDRISVSRLAEMGLVEETRDGWFDLVSAPFTVELVPPGARRTITDDDGLHWVVRGAVAGLLFQLLPDDLTDLLQGQSRPESDQVASDSGSSGRSPWTVVERGVGEATRMLLREAFATPSAIRVRTANEVLDASGPVVRRIALSVACDVLQELLQSEPGEFPLWVWQRAVHMAALRGGAAVALSGPYSESEARSREQLVRGCLDAAARPDLDRFIRARAVWSIGDLIDKEFPSRTVVDELLGLAQDPTQPSEVRTSSVRALGLLHRASYRSRLQELSAMELTHGESRMLRWALSWYSDPLQLA